MELANHALRERLDAVGTDVDFLLSVLLEAGPAFGLGLGSVFVHLFLAVVTLQTHIRLDLHP